MLRGLTSRFGGDQTAQKKANTNGAIGRTPGRHPPSRGISKVADDKGLRAREGWTARR
jgi:hypothetical protein